MVDVICYERRDTGRFVAGEQKAAKLIISRDDCCRSAEATHPLGLIVQHIFNFLIWGLYCEVFIAIGGFLWTTSGSDSLVVHGTDVVRQSQGYLKEKGNSLKCKVSSSLRKALNVEVWMWLRRTVVD
jgi:hypothetical protein